ncbi:scarecrow-like protein 3 [Silene latifolia]|uniref:scarecrow-like protein 3 n=1 Tax=Silene latifolia TaxID=37657 RepID=UPI003D788481
MGPMLQDDGSSVTSSPLQFFSMMSPNLGFNNNNNNNNNTNNNTNYPWLRELKPEERGLYLIHLLLSCANHVSSGNLDNANLALEQISHLSTPDGDTMQRIASYFAESLSERVIKSWSGLYRALQCTRMPVISDEILARKLFFELFPFLKLAFIVSNNSIIEAMEGEKMVHIIDLSASEPAQWIALIQALSARPEGPPHLRITGVHHQKEVLDQLAHRLTEEAEKLDLPFQFNSVVSKLENLDIDKLRVKTGEALAICSTLQLHTLLASEDDSLRRSIPPLAMMKHANGTEGTNDSASSSPQSVNYSSKMDGFLNALWGLSPKIMVIAEQDSSHNGLTLMERLSEALYYYASLFDCLESTLPRSSLERRKVEKMLLGEEIKNIIACEGGDRRERHEKLEKWFQRFDLAGFVNVPLSYIGVIQARSLLQGSGCDGYRIKEENGSLVMCWQDRPLYFVSTWRCRR